MKSSQKVQIKRSPGAVIRDVHYTVGDGGGEESDGKGRQAVKVLFLAANPDATSRLRLDQEAKAIAEALRSSRRGELFELEQGWAVADRDLQDGLLRYEPDIVHLSMHGSRGGRLILDEEGATLPEGAATEGARIRALGRIFGVARGRIRCVVLNACYSMAVAELIAEHVGCVVGMADTIEDLAAIRFSWSFYNALGYGASVKNAFDLAVAQVALGGWSRGEDIPHLVVSRVDPAEVSFV